MMKFIKAISPKEQLVWSLGLSQKAMLTQKPPQHDLTFQLFLHHHYRR